MGPKQPAATLRLISGLALDPPPLDVANSLKLLAAASFVSLPLDVAKELTVAPTAVLKTPLVEILDSKTVLFSTHAAISFIFRRTGAAVSPAAEDWLEWDELVLTPEIARILGGASAPSSAPLARLEAVLAANNGRLLQKDGTELPEIAVAATLRAAFASLDSVPSALTNVKAFLQRKLAEAYFVSAVARLTTEVHPKDDLANHRKIKSGVELATKAKKDKVLPVPGERNILITSALPYVNNVPHLGNIIGCVLSADVYARYCRLRGYNTLYICGTDEYGTATETKALEEKTTPQAICDRYHKLHAEIYKWFEIDFDHFGRTTTPHQTNIAQDIFKKLNSNGYMEENTLQQLYCTQCSRFLADRFVEGICPFCNYNDARGDQCDSCGKLINAIELKEPRCKLDGNTPVVRSSTHMFLDLAQLQPKCEAFVAEKSVKGEWSPNGISITQNWLREGLKPRCITRDLKWGTPVPLEKMKDKVFYVWFDAPIGYLSITANYTSDWEKWWKNPKDVELWQFMGKDNVPFHTVIFPCSLIGTNEDWTLLHHISTTEYLQYENGKFSKSRGVGVFGDGAASTGIPPSVWRFYLLSVRPETADSQFSWGDLALRNNGELLANFGNLVSRVCKFTCSPTIYAGIVPARSERVSADEIETRFRADVATELAAYIEALDKAKIRSGLQIAMRLSSRVNEYISERKLERSLFEKDPEVCATTVATALELIYILSALLEPYMPSACESVRKQLNAPPRPIPSSYNPPEILAGHRLGTPELLFKRIEEKQVEQLRSLFAGKQEVKPETKTEQKPAPK